MQFVSTNNFFQKIFLGYLGTLRGPPEGASRPTSGPRPPVEKRCPKVCRTQSNCFEYATLQSACGFTNGHIEEIHENSLEYPGVIDTKSD